MIKNYLEGLLYVITVNCNKTLLTVFFLLGVQGTMEKQEKKGYVGIMENQEFQGEMVNLALRDSQVCLKLAAGRLLVCVLYLGSEWDSKLLCCPQDQKVIKALQGSQGIQEFQEKKDQLVKWVYQVLIVRNFF